MDNVQLIVTGNLEKLALHKALGNAFPSVEFMEPVQSQGFTSVDISQLPSQPDSMSEEREVDKLVTALFYEMGRRKPANMIIVIDDLETVNLHHPEFVVKYFRHAINAYIQNHHITQRILKKLRDDCSFHLFVPMAEAYFFGEEPEALIRAGATLPSTVSGQNMDVENFLVANDTNYLTAPKGTSFWAQNPNDRARHPKRYLDYLCCPEMSKNRKARYKETRGGVNALKTLDWESVFSGNPNHTKYLRSLFDDISWRFNLPNPYPGDCAPMTDCRNGEILRNI